MRSRVARVYQVERERRLAAETGPAPVPAAGSAVQPRAGLPERAAGARRLRRRRRPSVPSGTGEGPRRTGRIPRSRIAAEGREPSRGRRITSVPRGRAGNAHRELRGAEAATREATRAGRGCLDRPAVHVPRPRQVFLDDLPARPIRRRGGWIRSRAPSRRSSRRARSRGLRRMPREEPTRRPRAATGSTRLLRRRRARARADCLPARSSGRRASLGASTSSTRTSKVPSARSARIVTRGPSRTGDRSKRESRLSSASRGYRMTVRQGGISTADATAAERTEGSDHQRFPICDLRFVICDQGRERLSFNHKSPINNHKSSFSCYPSQDATRRLQAIRKSASRTSRKSSPSPSRSSA